MWAGEATISGPTLTLGVKLGHSGEKRQESGLVETSVSLTSWMFNSIM